MKKIFPIALFCSFWLMSAPARAAEDCSKSADACRQTIKKVSPFMAEVKKVEKVLELKQGMPKDPELKQGRPHSPELKQGKSKDPELKPAPVATPSAPASGAAPENQAEQKTLSKPAWLLVMFTLLAGLYFYLREGKKRGKKN